MWVKCWDLPLHAVRCVIFMVAGQINIQRATMLQFSIIYRNVMQCMLCFCASDSDVA